MTEDLETDKVLERGDREGALWREAFEHEEGSFEIRPMLRSKSSGRAIEMIVEFEVTSRKVYERKYRLPIWPGGQSGVTIGIGYDVGHTDPARVRTDWGGVLPKDMVIALERAIGVKGPSAEALAAALADQVDVPWEAAYKVFVERTLPFWEHLVLRALPKVAGLNPDSFGALVSLTYNRGASYSKPGGRYQEMRAIKTHLELDRPHLVPDEIRAMKRLWPDVPGLQRRREREADLFESGLDRVRTGVENAAESEAWAELRRAVHNTVVSLSNSLRSREAGFFLPSSIENLEIEIRAGGGCGMTLRFAAERAGPTAEEASQDRIEESTGVLPPGVQALLSPRRGHKVVGRADIDDATFLLLDQFDEEAGGQLLVELAPGEEPRLVAADSVIFGSGAAFLETPLGRRLAAALGASEEILHDASLDVASSARQATISERVYEQALACEGVLSSRNVQGTNGGRLACAWAVNEIVTRATGRPIGGGLSTAKMAKVLWKSATPISLEEAEPGTVIISPTTGGVTGHVGIVGRQTSAGDKLVYSNSSSRALFVRNYTSRSWRERYERGLGLRVLFYRLNETAVP